ncbi:hypothetical protein JTB14_000034 [Gonioctena quinquepunctata]|nr:hypothetical protein JTB14_000034 [Gonioctena quinquepunctata]
MPSPSHFIIDSALMTGLAEAGHDVTLISPFSEKNPPKKGSWREIIIEGLFEEHEKMMKTINPFLNPMDNPFLATFFMNSMGNRVTQQTLQYPAVQELLKSDEKFDAVIVSQFLDDGLSAFATHFNVPLILLSTVGANLWNNHLVGNPALPSFYPEILLNYQLKMTLFERVKNTLFRIWIYINLNFIFYPAQNQIIQKYFPNPIDLQDSLYNVSLLLLNSHISFSKPQARVPNMIEIGGFHVNPAKKLPGDLQKFLDNAKEGVIYFSMGSNLKSKMLPVEVRDAILRVFGRRKEKILWKWEDEVLPGQPSNVLVKKWFPQQDILAHPNVKVFMTHGGLLSSIEAVYHGVPLLAIPIFGDQNANANFATQLGYGLKLPFLDMSEDKLSSLLKEIIENPEYRENVKTRSQIMKDRQIKPLDNAVYWVEFNDGARILGVFPIPARSHYIVDSALMRGLAEAGHDVTLISPFSEKVPPKNGSWREIILEGVFEDQQKIMDTRNPFLNPNDNKFLATFFMNSMGNRVTQQTLQCLAVQELLKSDEVFDAVIVGHFLDDGIFAFATHFNAHLILLSAIGANFWNNNLVGNPALPSFYPEIMLNYQLKMTLCERVKNTLYRIWNYINLNFIFYPSQNQIIREYFPNPIDLEDSLSNVSLVLLNSHVSFSKPQVHVPNMIEIGGFHIKPTKKLPDDLQIFLDTAKEGVIYFSMGSNLKSKILPSEVRNAILRVFGRRKEKILWKWEDEVLPGQPSNVLVKKWLPQQDILAHPNVKVFMTHGGLLSSIEAIYHGVPMLAIPIFGDQNANSNFAKQLGYGLKLPFSDISEEKLASLLEEIINNPKYRENVKTRSQIMKDRQIKPLDNAVYWVEYVIRHKGAKHLRVGYMHLTWYQYYMFDVFAIIFGIIFLLIFVLKKVLTFMCKRKTKITKQKKN